MSGPLAVPHCQAPREKARDVLMIGWIGIAGEPPHRTIRRDGKWLVFIRGERAQRPAQPQHRAIAKPNCPS
jgi:hypothetical protein